MATSIIDIRSLDPGGSQKAISMADAIAKVDNYINTLE